MHERKAPRTQAAGKWGLHVCRHLKAVSLPGTQARDVTDELGWKHWKSEQERQNPKEAHKAKVTSFFSHSKGWNTLPSLNMHNENFVLKKPLLLAMFQYGFQQILNYSKPLLVCFYMSQAISNLTALWQTFKHLQKYKTNLVFNVFFSTSSSYTKI